MSRSNGKARGLDISCVRDRGKGPIAKFVRQTFIMSLRVPGLPGPGDCRFFAADNRRRREAAVPASEIREESSGDRQ